MWEQKQDYFRILGSLSAACQHEGWPIRDLRLKGNCPLIFANG